MHYFPGWSEKDVMNMTYEKFTMYLATIPDYGTDEEDDAGSAKPKTKTKNSLGSNDFGPITGSFNLFDLDQRKK